MARSTVTIAVAVVAVGVIGAGGGAAAGLMTRAEPVTRGAAVPMSPPPSTPKPSTPQLTVNSDPTAPPAPPAFEEPRRWKSRELPRGSADQDTIRVDVPRDWTDLVYIRAEPVEGRFRLVREYYLRVLARPDMTSLAQARDARAAELKRNNTPGLHLISTDSGVAESRIDGTTRRYEELFYSFVDITDHNYRRFVRLRWVEGLELAVTGRGRDIEALASVLDRATQTIELVAGDEADKPG